MPRHPIGDQAMTAAERMRRHRTKAKAEAKTKPKAALIRSEFWLDAEILAKIRSDVEEKNTKKGSKTNMSRQVEMRLRQSFAERYRDGDRTHAVTRLFDLVIRETVGGKTADWLSDPAAFDEAAAAINATLTAIRPAGNVPKDAARYGVFSATAILLDLQLAPDVVPNVLTASLRTIELVAIRKAIGDLVVVGGMTAKAARESRKMIREFAGLRRKQWKQWRLENPAAKETPDSLPPGLLSAKDHKRMLSLWAEIEALAAPKAPESGESERFPAVSGS